MGEGRHKVSADRAPNLAQKDIEDQTSIACQAAFSIPINTQTLSCDRKKSGMKLVVAHHLFKKSV